MLVCSVERLQFYRVATSLLGVIERVSNGVLPNSCYHVYSGSTRLFVFYNYEVRQMAFAGVLSISRSSGHNIPADRLCQKTIASSGKLLSVKHVSII